MMAPEGKARDEILKTLRFGVTLALGLYIVVFLVSMYNARLVRPYFNTGWLLIIVLLGIAGIAKLKGFEAKPRPLSKGWRLAMSVVSTGLVVAGTIPVVSRYDGHWLWVAGVGLLAGAVSTVVLGAVASLSDDDQYPGR